MFIPTVLTEVLAHPGKKYVVISDTENIRKFFGFLSIPNVIYHHYGTKGKFDIIQGKKELWGKVSTYQLKQVVFFHAEFGGMANWLLKKLSKTVPVYYCKIYDSIPAPHSHDWLRVAKIKLHEYLYWGVNMDVLQGANAFPSLPNSFFVDVDAQPISMTIDKSLIAKLVSSRLSGMNMVGKYVLLTGTTVHNGYYSEDVYTKLINSVIEAIGIENMVSKCHPRYSTLYGMESQLTQIPSFIPGNVLIDNYDCYIGFESTLLVEAAVAGKTAISLIDFFPTSELIGKSTHAFFNSRLEGKGTILFPKNMRELKSFVERA